LADSGAENILHVSDEKKLRMRSRLRGADDESGVDVMDGEQRATEYDRWSLRRGRKR